MKVDKNRVERTERWKRGRLGEKQMEVGDYRKKVNKTYSQKWNAYNLAQTQEFKIFQDILIELIDRLVQIIKPYKKNGRPTANLKDMLFCCVMKVYMGKSSRRNVGYLHIAKGLGYISKVPHFNTVLGYFNKPDLTAIFKHLIEHSGIPLKEIEKDFTTDSSGFSTSLFKRWLNIRLREYRDKRLFKKAHVTSGVKTNIITAVNITEGYRADCPEFENLVRITAKNFDMREMSADAAYLSRANFNLIFALGGIPYIMFKKNSVPNARGSRIYSRMFFIYKNHRQEFLDHYHKRSNAESVFNMIKRKFGLHLYCRKEIGQINELLCKCLAHNICVLIEELFEANTILDYEDCERKLIRGFCAD